MPFLRSLLALFIGASAATAADIEPKVQKRELESLIDSVLPFAEQMLREHGEFFPFGATMDAKGTVAAVGGSNGEEHPQSQEIIDLLKAAFRREGESGKIRACALAYDIRIVPPGQKDKTDAVSIDLDHRNGMSVVMIYPYKIGADKKVAFGEPFAQKGDAEIFGNRSRSATSKPATAPSR